MSPEELYKPWKPVWDKCPELKPVGVTFHPKDIYHDKDRMYPDTSPGHAEAIINWTAMEWLAKKGLHINHHCAPGMDNDTWWCESYCRTTTVCDTPTEALNSAVRAVLEI